MWLIFTSIFVVFQIVFLQLFKVATKNTKSTGALTVLVQIISSLSILTLCPFYEWTWPTQRLTWLLLGITFALYAVNDRLDAITRKNLDISVDTMIHQVYRIFFLISGIVFLGRSFMWLKFLGCILIIIANIFVFFEKGTFKFNKWVLLKVLSAMFFTAAFTLETHNSPKFNLPFFVFMSFGVPAVYLMIARQAAIRGLFQEVRRKEGPVILLCGLAQGICVFAILRAYQFHDRFFEVAAVSAIYVILNVFFAFVFLKERNNLLQKFIASAIIVGSIVLICL